jgi:hypothetical protein
LGRLASGGDSSKLQGDLNFAFDQLESKVNLHKTSSPSKVSPDLNIQMQARHARLILFFFFKLKSILFLQLMEIFLKSNSFRFKETGTQSLNQAQCYMENVDQSYF